MNTHYTASKGGMIGFVRALASEVGDHGVTINAIAAELVRTRTTETGAPGQMGWFDALAQQQAIEPTEVPEDMVRALSLLTSDAAAFITGQPLLLVDGGWMRI